MMKRRQQQILKQWQKAVHSLFDRERVKGWKVTTVNIVMFSKEREKN